jgi:hypothetical protein
MEGHPICKQGSMLPSRVLQINSETITLVDTIPDQQLRYAALSYCWGSSNTVTTTSTNIDDMRSRLPVVVLPRVIQDAVHLSEQLDISYLWVDALCIAQDVADDLEKELAQMCSIYENAVLAIAASSSRSSDISFLRRRQDAAAVLVIPCLDDNGQHTVVKARKRNEGGLHYSGFQSKDPWELRAWTLQEKLLSTRLVTFAREEVLWECKILKTCQCRGSHSSHFDGGDPVSLFQLATATDAYKFWQV